MDVSMVANVIAGYGTDLAGDFLIQGIYSDTDLTINWDKQYHKHLIKNRNRKSKTSFMW